MPPIRHGRASFPGVGQVTSARYTLSQGITPSVAEIEFAPQSGWPAEGGDFIIEDGVTRVTIPGCKVAEARFARTGQGMVWQVAILDRRWKWQYGEISGSYNLRDAKGQIIPRTERTPQQLATLCLEAMGEVGFDVSNLPVAAGYRPTVQWDRDNPAAALADLCELFGCRVVYNPATDAATIQPLGVGAALPTGSDLLENIFSIDPPEQPDYLKVVGAPVRFNIWLRLVAVGLERDGSIVPIDGLSYKPASGWGGTNPPFFNAVSNAADRELAKRSVFRLYRITTQSPSDYESGLVLPPIDVFGQVDSIEQLLPIDDRQALVATHPAWSTNDPTKARVRGVRWNGAAEGTVNTGASEEYHKDFQIDRDDGIVEFSDYVFQWSANGERLPADLRLLTAVSFKSLEEGAIARYERSKAMGPPWYNTKPRVVRREDLALKVQVEYDNDFTRTGYTTNEDELDPLADRYLLDLSQDYQLTAPQTATYAGLQPILVDGAIQQVTWNVGPSGATTQASRNTEHRFALPSYEERRRLERDRRVKVRGAADVAAVVGAAVSGGLAGALLAASQAAKAPR